MIHIAAHIFGSQAIDHLLRWCYDGSCSIVGGDHGHKDPERGAVGIVLLWKLADYVQCTDLCDNILNILRQGTLFIRKSFCKFGT